MKPDFEKFLKKISDNNMTMMDSIRWNAEAFRKEVEETVEKNYVSRPGAHILASCTHFIIHRAQVREKYLEEQQKVKKLEQELEMAKSRNSHSDVMKNCLTHYIVDLIIIALKGKTSDEETRIGDEIEVTHTIKIGDVKFTGKSTTSGVADAEMNGADEWTIRCKITEAASKAYEKARKE